MINQKQNSKQRLFEIMGRLDKTFKPTLNEDFEGMEDTEKIEMPMGGGEEAPVEEKSPEEKLAELTAKVDEMYALLHGQAEETGEEISDMSDEEGDDIGMENLQEWNFDKKKGEKEEKSDDGDDDDSDDDTDDAKEDKNDLDESDVAKPSAKIPVAAIAKVGK